MLSPRLGLITISSPPSLPEAHAQTGLDPGAHLAAFPGQSATPAWPCTFALDRCLICPLLERLLQPDDSIITVQTYCITELELWSGGQLI